MQRWMTAVGAAVALAAGSASAIERAAGSAAAAPGDVKVADDVWNGTASFSGLDFATSTQFGRAWLVLHYRSSWPCLETDGDCEFDSPVPVSVPGLAYDPAARQVVYERDGAAPVVCANVRDGRSPTSTGACTYRLVKVDRVVDDGFAGRRDRREEVHFAIEGT